MWIKICGIKTPGDAALVADAGGNAIGLNFFTGSKRYIEPRFACDICEAVRGNLDVVGVFVNSPPREVADIVKSVPLDIVQFHGDESAEQIAEFHQFAPSVEIIRAFRIDATGLTGVQEEINELVNAGIELKCVLVDAFVAGEYGGTGRQIAPELLQNRPQEMPPLILAGGLTPATVADAVLSVQPWGVDTASGVESAPGVKDEGLVREFVEQVRSAEMSDG